MKVLFILGAIACGTPTAPAKAAKAPCLKAPPTWGAWGPPKDSVCVPPPAP